MVTVILGHPQKRVITRTQKLDHNQQDIKDRVVVKGM